MITTISVSAEDVNLVSHKLQQFQGITSSQNWRAWELAVCVAEGGKELNYSFLLALQLCAVHQYHLYHLILENHHYYYY